MASNFLKRHTCYLRVRDLSGHWILKASKAATKTEAKRLAVDLQRRFERLGLGLEAADLDDGAGTVAEMMEWWIETFLRQAPSYESTIGTIRKHIVGAKIGRLPLAEVTPGKIDVFLTEKERVLSPRSVNHRRGFLRRAFRTRPSKRPRIVDLPRNRWKASART